MKVTAIKRFCFWDSEKRKYFIVKVETDRGVAGLGEVGIPHWGGAIDQAIEHLSEIVIGQIRATKNCGKLCSGLAFFQPTKSTRVR
ncbi:MAG: hypothetical protein CM1200mP24_02450 [Gammaproteobacteria bacterium]|nr:MAG: hypothetical protein CM1200mP24_02450 [Gammaproteobacteria bacterium]